MTMQATDRGPLRASARPLGRTLRNEVHVGGRHVLYTDEPPDLGGGDTGPAPHELLPAALAACVSTTLTTYARARDIEIGGLRVDVDYDHRSTPRRFAVTVHLDESLAPELVERLQKVAEACPVRRAIEAGVAFEERIALDAHARPQVA
jgi:putative redox protein